MDFNYQNPLRKVVPKMWSAECGKTERKWEEELKKDEKKDINTNGYKIQIRYKNIAEIEYFTLERAPRNNCRFEFANLVEF